MIDSKILPDGVYSPHPKDGLRSYLKKTGKNRSYPAKQVILKPSSIPQQCYMVLSGRVLASTEQLQGGQNLVLAVFEEGNVFALGSMLTGRYCGVSYVTAAETVLKEITYSEINLLLRTNPSFLLPVIESIVVNMDAALTRMLGNLSYEVDVRIANTLLDMAAQFGVSEDGTIELMETPTQDNFAAMVGSHRITVTKNLQRMRDQGLVDVDQKAYRIPDMQKLVEWRNARVNK